MVGIATIVGIITLGQAIGVWVAVGAGALALLAAWLPVGVAVLRVAGAAVVATLGLLAFNVFTHPFGRPPILLGLLIAVVVYAWGAYWFLRAGLTRRVSLIVGSTLALAFVIVLPFAFGDREEGTAKVPARTAVASKLDIVLVAPAGAARQQSGPAAYTPSTIGRDFDVRWSVAVVRDDVARFVLRGSDNEAQARATVDEALTGPRASGGGEAAEPGTGGDAPAPDPRTPLEPRPGADVLVLLLVDGSVTELPEPRALAPVAATEREVGRWRRIGLSVAPDGAPLYALLQSPSAERLRAWARFADPGGAVSTRDVDAPSVTEAALTLAIGAPTAKADLALAFKHRPVLLFDPSERVPLPLSIEGLFAAGRISQCEDRRVSGSDCTVVKDPRALVNGGTHLEISAERGDQLTSAIYVHPVGEERSGRRLLYLDYWWYLPSNPAGAGYGAFCGAGLVIPGISCFDHESDWEGITVVIDRTGDEPRPIAVHYAAHDAVVRYDWTELRRRWDREPRLARFSSGVEDATARPLVFVASGTHASYPVPCSRGCVQTAHPNLEERVHRGTLPWSGNDTTRCREYRCVRLLPTRAAGTLPALWNAFEGVWGKRSCVLRVYCDSGSPPAAPGTQGRYKFPARYGGYVRDGRYRKVAFTE